MFKLEQGLKPTFFFGCFESFGRSCIRTDLNIAQCVSELLLDMVMKSFVSIISTIKSTFADGGESKLISHFSSFSKPSLSLSLSLSLPLV